MDFNLKDTAEPLLNKTQNMDKTYLALIIVSVCLKPITFVGAASLQDAKRLQADLANGYNRRLRPVQNQDDPVNVSVALVAIALQEFDEVLEKFSIVGAFELRWQDENMVWNPANYSGISDTVLGYEDVWVPELILTNPSDKLDSFGKDWQVIRFYSDGWAEWFPAGLIKATCSVNVYYFPFDIQECKIETYVWAYAAFEVKLISIRDTIYTHLMPEHGSWSVIGTEAKAEINGAVYKGTFMFRLQRKPQYIIVNVVLPILFLCILNVLVFFLPPESGERVSYAITVLLSIAVFMTIVSDTLPKTSEPLPLISYLLMISLIISSIIAVITIFNLRLFHKKSDTVVPNWLIRTYQAMRWSACTRRCKSNRVLAEDLNEDHNTNTGINHSPLNKMAILEFENETNERHHGNKTRGDSTESSADRSDICTWQDISEMVDYISLIVTTSVTILGFITFLIVTKVASN